jgi:hypothetical protein
MTATYEFHPLADIFPLTEGAEFTVLLADIGIYGLLQPIAIYEGKILDGRNRYRACLQVGVEPRFEEFKGDDPVAFVVSANIIRRHLSPKQKRDLATKLLVATPEKSDRQIAETVKVNHETVGAVRKRLEANGDVAESATRTDTKGRKQPAKKKTGAAKATERRRKDRERREAKQRGQAAETWKSFEAGEAQAKVEAERLAADLIRADHKLAKALHAHLLEDGTYHLTPALGRLLGLEGNGADAEASVEAELAQPPPADDGDHHHDQHDLHEHHALGRADDFPDIPPRRDRRNEVAS